MVPSSNSNDREYDEESSSSPVASEEPGQQQSPPKDQQEVPWFKIRKRRYLLAAVLLVVIAVVATVVGLLISRRRSSSSNYERIGASVPTVEYNAPIAINTKGILVVQDGENVQLAAPPEYNTEAHNINVSSKAVFGLNGDFLVTLSKNFSSGELYRIGLFQVNSDDATAESVRSQAEMATNDTDIHSVFGIGAIAPSHLSISKNARTVAERILHYSPSPILHGDLTEIVRFWDWNNETEDYELRSDEMLKGYGVYEEDWYRKINIATNSDDLLVVQSTGNAAITFLWNGTEWNEVLSSEPLEFGDRIIIRHLAMVGNRLAAVLRQWTSTEAYDQDTGEFVGEWYDYVHIYDWTNGSHWSQIGSSIMEEDKRAWSVGNNREDQGVFDISSDGSVFCIGFHSSFRVVGGWPGGSFGATVGTYAWDGADWVYRGGFTQDNFFTKNCAVQDDLVAVSGYYDGGEVKVAQVYQYNP